ncbi:MAG: hypothetical protein HY741_09175 [Chloroflexi bacterium]|nr:hypothetical protein [Chloroflexota bacterium]
MPIYEYECDNKHRFEKWQSIKDDALTECPTCGSAVRKIFHPAGIIFKGSGWYITDNRKSSGSESKSEGKSETPSTAKSEPASETKDKTASDTKSSAGSNASKSSD